MPESQIFPIRTIPAQRHPVCHRLFIHAVFVRRGPAFSVESCVTVSSAGVIHRRFRRPQHGDLLQHVIPGQRTSFSFPYENLRVVLIIVPAPSGPKLVDPRKHPPRVRLLIPHVNTYLRRASVGESLHASGPHKEQKRQQKRHCSLPFCSHVLSLQ